MKTVIVASQNPVKIEVAKRAFAALFPETEFEFISTDSPSGVSDQPYGDDTYLGASNRLTHIHTVHPDADYWISQEGGIYTDGTEHWNQAWILVKDRDGNVGKSATAKMFLPKKLIEMVLAGQELGHAGNEFFGTENIKHKSGVIGELTNGNITRADYYTQAAMLALGQLLHPEWFK